MRPAVALVAMPGDPCETAGWWLEWLDRPTRHTGWWLELVAGGCADDNVSSRLVGEVVDVVGMVADR